MPLVTDHPPDPARRQKASPKVFAPGYLLAPEPASPAKRSWSPNLGRGLAILSVLWGLVLNTSRMAAAEVVPTEYQVKAAYLFNFVKYVEWPTNAFQNPTAPFLIGVLGQDPFGTDLERTIAGRTINNRPIVVRRLADEADAKQCHILFISTPEKPRFEKILDSLRGSPILTVADADTFLELGGVIDFVTRDNKVRFRANLNSARASQLKISSRLLSVADAVVGKPEGGQP
jgi:hypothetical protein